MRLTWIFVGGSERVTGQTDPKLLQPTEKSVWEAGRQELISWDPQWRRSDGQHYNNFTRVTLELHERTSSVSSQLIAVIQRDYPFSLGQLLWNVPFNWTDGRGKSMALGNNEKPAYFVFVYPSYFDFQGRDGCRGCKARAPRGPLFMIKQAGKINFQLMLTKYSYRMLFTACQPNCPASPPALPLAPPKNPDSNSTNGDVSAIYPPSAAQSDYLNVVRTVGLAIGMAALVGFIIAFFVYNKRGRRLASSYRRRVSSFKYHPRPMKEASVTSLGSALRNPSFYTPDAPGEGGDGACENVSPRNSNGTDLDASTDAVNPIIDRPAIYYSSPPPTVAPPLPPVPALALHARLPVLELPPSPPKGDNQEKRISQYIPTETEVLQFPLPVFNPYQQDHRQSIIVETHSSSSDIPSRPNTPPHQLPFARSSSTTPLKASRSTPSINKSEAILVGNTFRNALRVTKDRPSHDSVESKTETTEQAMNPEQTSGPQQSSEENLQLFAPVVEPSPSPGISRLLTPSLKNEMETGCSPVLSRLAWVEEEPKHN